MKHAAVLGHPIGHSKSPLLHGAAYAHLGAEISYTRIDLDELRLGEFLEEQSQDPGWAGWSVTMPLKAAMVPHMDSVSARVRTLGVLNTVVFRPAEGGEDAPGLGRPRLHGENTDVDGIVTTLIDAGVRAGPADGPPADPRPADAGTADAGTAESSRPRGRFAVLGSGGTAAAVLGAAAELGFAETVIYARTPERAETLRPTAAQLGLGLEVRPLGSFPRDLSSAAGAAAAPEAVVSTLPPRAADGFAEDLPGVSEGLPLLDVAYDPWPSALAESWRRRGGAVASGLEMLLHQAVRQVELFTEGTGRPAEAQTPQRHAEMVAAMRAAL